MAKATIMIEDLENGNAKVTVVFDPPLQKHELASVEDLTAAQYLAMQAVSAIHDDEELSAVSSNGGTVH